MKALLLALACALCLTACGGGGGQGNEDRDEENLAEPQLLAAVLFKGSISEPPTALITFALEGAGRVGLGSTTPEEGVRTLPPVDEVSGGSDFALLATQLTDGNALQTLFVEANRNGVTHSLGSGNDGSMMVRLAPDAASGQLDLVGHEVTALQVVVEVNHLPSFVYVRGAVQVFGYRPTPSADGERALALVPYPHSLIGRALLPGRVQLDDVTLVSLEDAAIGLQDMIRDVDDPNIESAAGALTDGVAGQVLTWMRPNDASPSFRQSPLLPLVDLIGADLVGFEITGMRYHSWNAYNTFDNPNSTQLDGAVVIYGLSP